MRFKNYLAFSFIFFNVVASALPGDQHKGPQYFPDLSASTVQYLDSNKKFTSSAVTNTELGYLSGVTSSLQTQLGLKAPLASPTLVTPTIDIAVLDGQGSSPSNPSAGFYKFFVKDSDGKAYLRDSSGTETQIGSGSGGTWGSITGTLSAQTDLQSALDAKQATGNYVTALTGEVTASGPGSVAATVTNSAVIGKVLTGYSSGSGTVSATDTILQGFNKLNGNDALKQPLATLTTKGDIYVATGASTVVKQGVGTNNYVLTSDSGQTNGIKWAPAAASKNNISNYNIETDTSGYSTYADAAATSPVNGTAGSPTVTIARSTTTPLRDLADLNFVKDAANRQGEGYSYDFTIAPADQGRVLSIGFDYEVVSGTYASGDVSIWVFDVTNNVLLPQPSANSIIATAVPTQQRQTTFQTAINSTSYRLIFHVTSTSASAYTLAFDNISVTPQVQASGSVDTDWAAYTPTATGFGTVSAVDFKWRRQGPNLVVTGQFTAGTTTGATAALSLPTGFVATNNLAANFVAGEYWFGATSTSHGGAVLVAASATTINMGNPGTFGNVSTNALTAAIGTTVAVSTNILYFSFTVPIAGWGSNTVLSTSANARAVVARAHVTSAASTTSANPINFETVDIDTVAGIATGVGTWKYTAAVPGYYKVMVSLYGGATGFAAKLFKNGSAYSGLSNSVGSTSPASGGDIIFLNVGDFIQIFPSATITPTAYDGVSVATSNHVQIELLQSPQQIAASERISFSANTSSTAGTTSNPFRYTVIDDNSYAAYNSTSGVFTAPAPGLYHFDFIFLGGTTATPGLYKNGTLKCQGTVMTSGSTAGVGSCSFPMVVTDTAEIRPGSNSTASAGAAVNVFSGFRVGN